MNRFARPLVAVSLTALSLVFGASSDGRAADRIAPEKYFTLKDVDGKSVSLDSLLKENKAVLLNFWATWCPPCREEIPDLIRLQEQYKDRGFKVVGIDVRESAKKVTKFADKMGVNYLLLLDSDSKVSDQYGIVGIPTSLLVKPDGTILGEYHAAGPNLFADVEKALQ